MSLLVSGKRRTIATFLWILFALLAAVLLLRPRLLWIPAEFGPLLCVCAVCASVIASELRVPFCATDSTVRKAKLYAATIVGIVGLGVGGFRDPSTGHAAWAPMLFGGIAGALTGYSVAHVLAPIIVRHYRENDA